MPYYSRNVSLAIDLETGLKAGSGARVTIGAAVAGVLPLAAPAIGTPGTGYPASSTIPVRFISPDGIATAVGTVTTSAGGAITSATVTSGGGGYTNGAGTAFTIEGTETSYGAWSGPLQGATYLQDLRLGTLVGSDFAVKFNAVKIERDVLRGFMGGKETVPGDQWAEITFTTEMSPSGIKGLRPAWHSLLKAAGFSENYTFTGGTINKIDYAPVSDNFQSIALRAMFGGARLNLKGARVSKMEIDLTVNTLPTCKWTIIGLVRDFYAQGFTSVDLSHWAMPAVIMDSNTVDIKFGVTYNNATGATNGGIAYPSKGMTLQVENNAKFRPFLGGTAVPITQRETTGDFVADLTDAQRAEFYTKYSANTLESMAFSVGTVAGQVLRIYAPNVERQEPRNVDDDGLFLTGTAIRCRPSWVNGNDEIRFVLP